MGFLLSTLVALASLYHTELRRLDAVAKRLAFPVTDTDAANAAFQRWHDSGDEADREAVLHWAYCYVYRYFLTRFIRERHAPSDLDMVLDKAFRRVERSLSTVRNPAKFSNWVSVICSNAMRNFWRDRKDTTELEDKNIHLFFDQSDLYDRNITRKVVAAAISSLPPSLEAVARRVLLDQKSYKEVSEEVDLPVPSVRTYFSKAIARLREDPDVALLWKSLVNPP